MGFGVMKIVHNDVSAWARRMKRILVLVWNISLLKWKFKIQVDVLSRPITSERMFAKVKWKIQILRMSFTTAT